MTTRTAGAPLLDDLDPDDVADGYDRAGLGGLPDHHLVEAAATLIARPKAEAANSFVLHAPLELLARAALLQHVTPAVRDDARRRIAWLAATYRDAGADAVAPDADGFGSTIDARDAAVAAVAAGDVDGAGAAGAWLGRSVDALSLVTLVGDAVVPSLAAAAHGPIHLHHLPRVASRSVLAGAMFGNLARELARDPSWSLSWMDHIPFWAASATPGRRIGPPERGVGVVSADLVAALAEVPALGVPGSTFIQPLMHQAESSGVAAELVGPVIGAAPEHRATTVALLRIATASMLLDDREHAPYGWSHCLTMPQAVASIAPVLERPGRAQAVAATHVVGFRAGLGRAPLGELAGACGSLGRDGLVTDPPITTADDLQTTVDFAAVHPDAHLAKYTLACLDAARSDPEGAPQHLAAAVHLADWWRANPVTGDPLLDPSS